MNSKYDIHQDFARFPVTNFKFRGLLLWIINTLMKLHCFFVWRSLKLNVDKHSISRPDGSQLTVFTLTPPELKKPAPALIYYHGGGFAMTYASLHLKNCERYANEAGCIVVFVAYRLAPKQPFPSGFDDCYTSLEWTMQEADKLGVDKNKIAVGGDSAGGALAAGVAQKARDEHIVNLCAQFLVYPVLDHTCSTTSATDFVDVPLFNAISNRLMWEVYLGPHHNAEIPSYAAPGHGKLHNLPLSYVETAEFDPLRDEGLAYSRALQAEGTEVVINETGRTVHGYDGVVTSEITKHALLARIAFLNKAFLGTDKSTRQYGVAD